MSSFISAAPVASGQVQSLDSLRAHALPSDAIIIASSSQVNPANQNTGSYAIVESGVNSLGVTTTGSVPAVTQSPFADLYKEGSIYLNGTVGNYLQNTATYSNATINWATSGLTIEAWVNYPTFTGASVTAGTVPTSMQLPGLFGIMLPNALNDPFSFGVNTSGFLSFYYGGNSGTTSQCVVAQTAISTNTWNHIAVSVAPSGFIYLFVNGVQTQVIANRNGTLQSAAYNETVQGTPVSTSLVPLTVGQLNSTAVNAYVADLRLTTGAGLYTGSTSSYATFTVPSAPLSSTTSPGVTQFLLRAGSNAPYVSNGALTFDRGLKQYMNFGPQTFNVATRGFCAIFKITLTGVISSYEYLWQMSAGTPRFAFIRNGTTTTWYAFYLGAGGETDTGLVTIPQNTTSVVAVNYNPYVGTNGTWSVWLNGVNATSVAMGANTPIDFTASTLTQIGNLGGTQSFSANVFAFYNRALSNVEIYNSYLALNTVPATPQQKTLEIGDINGTPALSVAGNGQVSVQSIGLSSNVVPWPPAAMTGYVTSINGKNYVASASSDQYTGSVAYAGWTAFAKGASGALGWVTVSGTYNTSAPYGPTGPTTTVDVNGSSYPGEWLQIQIPSSIVLSNYQINTGGSATSQRPSKWFLLGSRDGVNWFLIDSQNGVTLVTSTFVTFTVPVGQAFTYFRWVVNQLGGAPFCNGGQIVYYGTADTSPSLTIAPATTFATSVATPSLSGIASNSLVPQDFSSSGLNIPAYVVSNTATVANTVAYSSFGPFAGEGSLYFPNGTGPYYGTYVNFPSSSPVCFDWSTLDFTIELWFYPTAYTQGGANAGGIFKRITWPVSTYQFEMTISSSGLLQFYDGASGAAISPSGTVTLNAWNHISACVSGSTAYVSLNGVVGSAAKGSFTYNSALGFVISSGIPGNGSWSGVNGYISNFRVVRGLGLYTAAFTPPTAPLQPIQGTTQAGLPYGTVLLLRNAPAPGRIQTTKFSGANSVGLGGAPQVLSFPPAAMTGYSTALNAGYGQGTYVASASSEFSGSWLTWYAFDKSNNSWISGGPYNSSTGVYTGTTATVDVTGTAYLGEWLQIQLPSSMVLSSYTTTNDGSGYSPSAYRILGSRDGTNWYLVDTRSGLTSTSYTFAVSSGQAFTYFRLVGTSTVGAGIGNAVLVREWTLNGQIEGLNINPDGKVGLGVVNPTRALEVAGDVVCGGTLSAGNPLMFRNAIYNGDMRINQRGFSTSWASPTAIGTSGTGQNYGLDRMNMARGSFASGGAFSQGTVATADLPYSQGIQYYLRLGRSSGNATADAVYFNQALETRESYKFAGQPVTLSLFYRTGAGFSGTGITLNITYGTGTDQNAVTGFTSAVTRTSPSFSASNAWQYATFTTFVPPTATQVATYVIYTPSGTAGGFDYFDITGVQLEKGTVATPFEVRPYATELALCQRYYQKSYSISVVPGTATESGNWVWYLPYLVAAGNNWLQSGPVLQVSMRAAPGIVFYTSGGVINSTWTANDGSTATTWRYLNNTSGGSQSAGSTYSYGWTANAEL